VYLSIVFIRGSHF